MEAKSSSSTLVSNSLLGFRNSDMETGCPVRELGDSLWLVRLARCSVRSGGYEPATRSRGKKRTTRGFSVMTHAQDIAVLTSIDVQNMSSAAV